MEENKKFVIRCRAIILHEGKLLVVRHAHDASFAALPGGHLEWGEDVKECLSREIIEELGVKPEIGRLLYINTFEDKNSVQPIEFFFEVLNGKDYLDSEKMTRTHAHELSEIYWASSTDNIKILPQKMGQDFREGKILSDDIRYIKGGER
jgi:ADP-ribose pyrophosphatase YjhB (NUDIX family)